MYTFAQRPYVFDAYSFRWLGRASAIVLAGTWLSLVLMEIAIFRFELPALRTFSQAAALGIVFAGYAIGWRKELLGGGITIVGTLAFFAVHIATLETVPELTAALFAVPGMFYLLAWLSDRKLLEESEK